MEYAFRTPIPCFERTRNLWGDIRHLFPMLFLPICVMPLPA